MTSKAKISNIINDVVRGIFSQPLNYYLSLHNIMKSKPKNIEIFYFSLFTYFNETSSDGLLYDDALNATHLHHQDSLKEFKFIEYYKGWIPDLFHKVEDKKFIVVNINIDLYKPIKDSLEFFYPHLAKGEIISLEDYGISQVSGAKAAVDEFREKNPSRSLWGSPLGEHSL